MTTIEELEREVRVLRQDVLRLSAAQQTVDLPQRPLGPIITEVLSPGDPLPAGDGENQYLHWNTSTEEWEVVTATAHTAEHAS